MSNEKVEAVARKLIHVGGREWGGYLMPMEIILVSKSGGTANNPRDLQRALERKQAGKSTPWHFYFTVRERSVLHEVLAKGESSLIT